ncbi:MAG: DUF4870 domain-containing protein [Chloroflexota bacterium]
MSIPERTSWPPARYPAVPGRPLSPARPPGRVRTAGHVVMRQVDQRVAAVAHLSIGFGVIVGVGFLLGLAINLVIWLRSRRSPVVEYHAEQAGAYQLAVLLANLGMAGGWILVLVLWMGDYALGWLSFGQILTAMLVLLPFEIAWYFGTIALGVYGGLVVAAGRDFSYPIFGSWARRRLEAKEAARVVGPRQG